MFALLRNSKFVTYCFFSAITAFCEIAIFVGLIDLVKLHYFYASPIAFCFAVVINYFFQRKITYKVTKFRKREQFFVFLVISTGGLLINWTITNIAISVLFLFPILAKMLAILLTLTYNYTLNTKITFKDAL